jgi:glycosyltransferase involved in cell wall biosynthesis
MTRTVVLNLLPIAKGGGLQNGMSFLRTLSGDHERRATTTVVCRDRTPLAEFCRKENLVSEIVPQGTVGRIRGEINRFLICSDARICLTLFGAPIFSTKNRMISVCGCAYSNLFYPELDFWNYLKGLRYWTKQFVDSLRRRTLQKADLWIFETEVLRLRAINLCSFPANRAVVIKMAPSGFVRKDYVDPAKRAEFARKLPRGFRLLMLAGAHPNKRQAVLPHLIEELRKIDAGPFVFITTMNDRDEYAKTVIAEIHAAGLHSEFCNIGPVAAQDCASLIEACDAMLCFSRLESFSNNFVEAWAMRKPLIVTDADWARDACRNGALYVDPTNPQKAASVIKQLIAKVSTQRELIAEGEECLGSYNTPESKYREYWKVIDVAGQLGFCSPTDRRLIRWPNRK